VKGQVYYTVVESVRTSGKPPHKYAKYIGDRALDLGQMINWHVFKGGDVDVGIRAIFIAFN